MDVIQRKVKSLRDGIVISVFIDAIQFALTKYVYMLEQKFCCHIKDQAWTSPELHFTAKSSIFTICHQIDNIDKSVSANHRHSKFQDFFFKNHEEKTFFQRFVVCSPLYSNSWLFCKYSDLCTALYYLWFFAFFFMCIQTHKLSNSQNVIAVTVVSIFVCSDSTDRMLYWRYLACRSHTHMHVSYRSIETVQHQLIPMEHN